MLAWGKYNEKKIVSVLLWSLYTIDFHLKDEHLEQQLVWHDLEANMFWLFLLRYMTASTKKEIWKVEQTQTPIDWAETFPFENRIKTTSRIQDSSEDYEHELTVVLHTFQEGL